MPQEEVVRMSVDEYWADIKDEYLLEISNTSPTDVYPSTNPGPTTPEGGVNFECHCVGHLVGSPCGFEFREAITCQKSSNEEQMQEGACGAELLSFMECVTRTQCFKSGSDKDDDQKK
uniref:CHCH domain-containing protein n=1 Tax=Caenorhabditis japonica TaxID=281687 RepID=A0A8R1DVS0_CAEJA